MTEITIVLPLPPKALSPNARHSHWGTRAAAAKRYRRDACMMAIAAGGRNLRWQRATAHATFYWPTRRRRDLDNAAASLKPAYDGLGPFRSERAPSAGLLADDHAGVLTHLPPAFKIDPLRPRVEIRVRHDGDQVATLPPETARRKVKVSERGKVGVSQHGKYSFFGGHFPTEKVKVSYKGKYFEENRLLLPSYQPTSLPAY